MSRIIIFILLMVFSPLRAFAAGASDCIAFELDRKVVINVGKKFNKSFPGRAPEFSPDGKKLAFLCKNDIFIFDLQTHKLAKITQHAPESPLLSYFRMRLRWHPSGKFIAYTCVQAYRYLPKHGVFALITDRFGEDEEISPQMTIWVVNVRNHNSWRAVDIMGNFRKLEQACQSEAASVYEPFFSPDGKYLGFANAGSIFQQKFDINHPKMSAKPKIVAWTGHLDLSTDGASKAGYGARTIAWDAKRKRLAYWAGRFWGASWISFGYVNWNGSKWTGAHEWKPDFAQPIAAVNPNIEFCAFDGHGRLWVSCYVPSITKYRWTRYDGQESLPVGADNPSFR